MFFGVQTHLVIGKALLGRLNTWNRFYYEFLMFVKSVTFTPARRERGTGSASWLRSPDS